MAVIHSSRTPATIARQGERRDQEARQSDRVGRVNALTGAAIEVAGHGGTFAQFQHRNLKTWRRFLPQNATQREIIVGTWSGLIGAVTAAAKALERLRYTDDDLLPAAKNLFDVVAEIQLMASRGELSGVIARTEDVRTLSIELQHRVRSSHDSSVGGV